MAVDMFIKIGDIKGESEDASHGEEIDVLAWSWSMSQSGTTHQGGGGGSGKVSVGDLSFTKYVDKSSHALMLACCKGTHIPKVNLVVRKAGDTPLEYIKMELGEVIISSVATGGSGGEDRLTENVSLNFATVKYSYQPQAAAGAEEGGSMDMAWNIPKNNDTV